MILEIAQIIFSVIILALYIAMRINKANQDIKNSEKTVKFKLKYKDLNAPLSKKSKTIYRFLVVTSERGFYNYFFYLIFTILGLFNFSFIAILLLDIFFLSPVLRTILSSIWRPKKQIFVTLVLLIIIQYIFSIVAYLAFSRDFSAEDEETGEHESGCENLLICFSIMFDSTFKFDGGFTGLFSQDAIDYIDEDFKIDSKAIYDFLYNFIILVLILQILSGIIIDTFGELRQESDEKTKDKKNFCFICGLNRKDLDHLGAKVTYNDHILKKHNMWNYLFYMAYIKEKKSVNFTGIETYVNDCMKHKDISWFPIEE